MGEIPPDVRVRELIRNAWADVLDEPDVSDDDNFFDLGGDSLAAIELMEKIEASIGIQFPLETLFSDGDFRTLADECVARLRSLAG